MKNYKNGQLLLERIGKEASDYLGIEEKVYDEKMIKPDGLFLRTLYFNGQLIQDSVVSEWIDYLKKSVYITAAPTAYDLQELSNTHVEYYENGGIEEINQFMEDINYEQRILYSNSVQGDYFKVESPQKMLFYERQGMHMPIPFVYESLGNRTLVKVLSSYLPV